MTFSALLYIPGQPPSGDRVMERITRNVRLYVKRVLVQDEWADELLPDYLHFVKGVIDSTDLTLNVDRDHLSKANSLRLIKRRVTTKLLSTFKHLYQFEPGVYFNFYKFYSGNLKYGVIEDPPNRRALSKLLMFFTSYSPNDLTTLDDYVLRMKKGQEKVYYIGSSSRESAAVSPYLEDLYSKGIEVIFAIEPIDLYCLDRMEEFDGIPLENPEKEKEKGKHKSQDMSNFNITQRDFSIISRWFKKTIGDRLEKLSMSTRLKSTPAIATCTNWGYTASHERLIRAQTVHDQKLTDSILLNRKVLEVNPEHPVIVEIFNRIKATPDDQGLRDDALLLYDTALIAGGFAIDGILNYTRRIFKMLGRAHNLEGVIDEFETENEFYYATIDDEFKAGSKANARTEEKEGKQEKVEKRKEIDEEEEDESPEPPKVTTRPRKTLKVAKPPPDAPTPRPKRPARAHKDPEDEVSEGKEL
jgi:HSP90 family molecular chaperone